MKKLLFILVLVFITLKSFSCERDSVFDIRLQHDSLAEDFNVIFKNITNDTVVLGKKYRDYITEFKYSPGFRVNFYFNGRLGIPNRGELPKQLYEIDNDKHFDKYRIAIAPEEEVILTIQLPFGLLIKSDTPTKTYNLCIVLELYYIYIIPKKKNGKLQYFKSECFEIKL